MDQTPPRAFWFTFSLKTVRYKDDCYKIGFIPQAGDMYRAENKHHHDLSFSFSFSSTGTTWVAGVNDTLSAIAWKWGRLYYGVR
mmetsp:Transcript_41496/g.62923  ORF Transcript_41496/g.62923 Transcript_41496/m.62923 type:complete len:84 (+) Transcript_41496:83-334(+)